MTNKQTIAIVGATGATAGGLVRAILDDPDGPFRCRALTRTPGSDAAQALAARGATVMQADTDDPESLVAAFDGAYGVFGMTTFWENFSAAQETQQAENIARAAATAGVRHAVWVTSPDSRQWFPLDDPRMPTIDGNYKVPQWDGKADGDAGFEAAGVPTTRLRVPFHWEAFVGGMGRPQPGPDGRLVLGLPIGEAVLPGIANDDVGRCALGIFAAGVDDRGEPLGIAGEHIDGHRLAQGLTQVLGEPVIFAPMPLDAFRALPFPGITAAANMCQVVAQVPEFAHLHQVSTARQLNAGTRSFDAWVRENMGSVRHDAPTVDAR